MGTIAQSDSTEILCSQRNPNEDPISVIYNITPESETKKKSTSSAKSHMILIGWDKFRTGAMVTLFTCFVIWAAVFFTVIL